ncbi:MAG: hypothetical protein JST55_09010 [Bacteroidetes bacterium]|nr:hypothetical protein [Bacteroidota bacterium]
MKINLKILSLISLMLLLISFGCNKEEKKELQKPIIRDSDLLSKDFLKEENRNESRWILLDEKINGKEKVKFFLDTLSLVRTQDTIQAWFKYDDGTQNEDDDSYFFRVVYCKERMFRELITKRRPFFDSELLRMYREKYPIVPYSAMETFYNKYCK